MVRPSLVITTTVSAQMNTDVNPTNVLWMVPNSCKGRRTVNKRAQLPCFGHGRQKLYAEDEMAV